MRHITGLILLLASINGFSQNIRTSTIEWSCNSTFSAASGNAVDETSKVISSPEQIIWYNSDHVAVQTLSITDTNGSWTNVSNNGSMIFNVNAGSDGGIVQIFRTDGLTKIRIHIVRDEDSSIFELTVGNFNAQ